MQSVHPVTLLGKVYWMSFLNFLKKPRKLTLREVLVGVFLSGYFLGGFLFFFWTFRFIHSFSVVGDLLLDRLWHFFFFILWFMLIFSNAVIAFSVQYKSSETFFLFGLPIRSEIIFFKQLLEGTVWSSWGFLFLATPLILAFGLSLHSPLYYYLGSIAFLLPFVLSAAVLGAFVTYIVLRLRRRSKNIFLSFMSFLIFALLLYLLLRFPTDLRSDSESQILVFLKGFLDGIGFSRAGFLPSTWLARGLMELSSGHLKEGFFFFGMLASTALVLADAAYFFGMKLYPYAWEKAQGGQTRLAQTFFSKLILKLRLPALIQKDVFLLLRDPTQWIQLIILAAIMVLYLSNLKNIRAYVDHAYWENIIYFMNLTAIGLMVATFSMRFVFPQFSLEWRRNWILGLVPLSFNRFVHIKFFFPCLFVVFVSQLMSLASNRVLDTSWLQHFLSLWILGFTSIGLVALSLSLGIIYPNLKTDNPSQIMSGLGGILNLVFSMTYLFAMLTPFSLLFHWVALGRLKTDDMFYFYLIIVLLINALCSILFSYLLLKVAKRHSFPE
jgi:ABC-2 type transport system permease protein